MKKVENIKYIVTSAPEGFSNRLTVEDPRHSAYLFEDGRLVVDSDWYENLGSPLQSAISKWCKKKALSFKKCSISVPHSYSSWDKLSPDFGSMLEIEAQTHLLPELNKDVKVLALKSAKNLANFLTDVKDDMGEDAETLKYLKDNCSRCLFYVAGCARDAVCYVDETSQLIQFMKNTHATQFALEHVGMTQFILVKQLTVSAVHIGIYLTLERTEQNAMRYRVRLIHQEKRQSDDKLEVVDMLSAALDIQEKIKGIWGFGLYIRAYVSSASAYNVVTLWLGHKGYGKQTLFGSWDAISLRKGITVCT